MSLQSDVAERYPALVPLLKVPEIRNLFTQAVSANWSPNMFQSRFMATRWFRSQSETQRRWWVTVATDPGEAKKQRQLYQQELGIQANRLGFTPTPTELGIIREKALQLGVAPDSNWVTQTLINLAQKRGGRTGPGEWTTTANQVRQIGSAEYLKAEPTHVVNKWTQWIVGGRATIEDYQDAARTEAMKRYPHLADELRKGFTVNDLISRQREMVAEELEYANVEQVNMNDPRWHQLLGIRDPKTNTWRMPTDSEVMTWARKDPGWGKTSKGRQAAASMTQNLLRAFGRRK